MISRLLAVAILAMALHAPAPLDASDPPSSGELLYANEFREPMGVRNWVMEGPGALDFEDGWMRMRSPGKKGHHVLWCPEVFPEDFIAEWEVQNVDPTSGLLIVFFAASGQGGKDLFDKSLEDRDGTFKQYTKGDVRSYHISYYANSLNKPDRGTLHLRKNPGQHLVAQSGSPIAADSEALHRIRLEKSGPELTFFIDEREVLSWIDTGEHGPPLGEGRIGFRQMRSTDFRYRNFRVYTNRE